MKLSTLMITGAVGSVSIADATANFHRDVISASQDKRPLPFVMSGQRANNIQDELLSKAMPLSEYYRQLKSLGVDVPSDALAAEGPGAHRDRQLENKQNADDYFIDDEDMYSLSGYSMKYAKCQPIQQFSEEALMAGEYSPMVTQDVVVLRLCPYKSCSSSRQYGCHYNYAEYAIGLNEYMQVMLRYRADKKERLCEWCAGCGANRRLEDAEQEEDAQDGGDENNNNQEEEDNGEENGEENDDNNNNANNYDENDECYTYSSYCDNYYYDCAADDEQQEADDDNYNYIAEEEYYNYLGCTELADKYGGIYFVRPTCDASDSTISMAVFYDEYCSQSASKVTNIADFQIAFDEEVFESMYNGTCIDCSESNYPPTFNANSYMCNKINNAGAACTNNMVYDLFDGAQSSTSTECSFIESIRFGTYDANGAISVQAAGDAEEVVTNVQKAGLIVSAIICTAFVIYACYLHHAMTNLLIKSLSHRELLPPSRHKRRESLNSSKHRRSKGSKSSRRSHEDYDDEWDRTTPV